MMVRGSTTYYEFLPCGIFDGPHATPNESDDGPIFLGIKNITEDGRLNMSEIRHVSEEEYPRWTSARNSSTRRCRVHI